MASRPPEPVLAPFRARRLSGTRCGALLAAGLLLWAGCSAGGKRPPGLSHVPAVARSDAAGPRFRLCSAGLPGKGNWKCDPLLVDFDGDGRSELLAFARLGDGPHVWRRTAESGWDDQRVDPAFGHKSCGGGLALADVNNDGRLDLIVADHCNGLYVYLGDGPGGWRNVLRAFPPHDVVADSAFAGCGLECVAAGDVNGDGFVDLVVGSSAAGGLTTFLGDGTGTCWTASSADLPAAGFVNRVQLVDVDGDGRLDLVATCDVGPRVWRGDGQGRWSPYSRGLPTPALRGLYQGLALGDFNADGRLDLCVANWVDGPEVYLQQADGRWLKTPDVFPQMHGGAYGVVAGDFDGDGRLDLVVSGRLTQDVGYVYGVFALRGDGRGGWTWLADADLPRTGLPFTWGLALGPAESGGALELVAGSGGVVASDPANKEPVAEGLLLWRVHAAPSAEYASGAAARP